MVTGLMFQHADTKFFFSGWVSRELKIHTTSITQIKANAWQLHCAKMSNQVSDTDWERAQSNNQAAVTMGITKKKILFYSATTPEHFFWSKVLFRIIAIPRHLFIKRYLFI